MSVQREVREVEKSTKALAEAVLSARKRMATAKRLFAERPTWPRYAKDEAILAFNELQRALRIAELTAATRGRTLHQLPVHFPERALALRLDEQVEIASVLVRKISRATIGDGPSVGRALDVI